MGQNTLLEQRVQHDVVVAQCLAQREALVQIPLRLGEVAEFIGVLGEVVDQAGEAGVCAVAVTNENRSAASATPAITRVFILSSCSQ